MDRGIAWLIGAASAAASAASDGSVDMVSLPMWPRGIKVDIKYGKCAALIRVHTSSNRHEYVLDIVLNMPGCHCLTRRGQRKALIWGWADIYAILYRDGRKVAEGIPDPSDILAIVYSLIHERP